MTTSECAATPGVLEYPKDKGLKAQTTSVECWFAISRAGSRGAVVLESRAGDFFYLGTGLRC